MARKRGQGDGSIYQRKDGLWVAAVTLQGRKLYKYTKTQKEARDWLKATKAQMDAGLTFAGSQVHVAEFMEYWLSTASTTIRPKTLKQYQQIAHDYICPNLGIAKLKDLRADQIQFLYNNLLEQGKSHRTVILVHAVIHRALVQALKLGLLGRNPADQVTIPKQVHTEMHTLDVEQAHALLQAVAGSVWEAAYYIAITTGLRQGELLGLKWSDLDWSTRQLHVQRQLQRIKGQGVVFPEPKTKAGRRVIVLGNDTIEKLHRHEELQRWTQAVAGARWKDNNLIFPNTIGNPQDPADLVKHFKALLRQVGLPDIRFHDLRHTAATLMLQQGIHPKIVQERLGHAQISMTLSTYSHVLPSMQNDAAEKMDDLLG